MYSPGPFIAGLYKLPVCISPCSLGLLLNPHLKSSAESIFQTEKRKEEKPKVK
ncbi:MAG: hypothetical protein M5T52_16695 [Ignavibacteriaceae bacterium]|nr:hypothetical protein [Ignavibacteriaceae bacterium]